MRLLSSTSYLNPSVNNKHRPDEAVLFVGLSSNAPHFGGFDPQAPVAGCRLCGAVFQTKFHRMYYYGDTFLLQKVIDLNNEWRYKHTIRKHSATEIDNFSKTGFAFTPEAAYKLSPFGIIPLGRLHKDIADSMFEAPRAPDLDNIEGGENAAR